MKLQVQHIPTAAQLPASWNDLAESYFQRRAFLDYTEEFNPCRQKYFLAYEGDNLRAGAIAYTLPLDLLTFLGIRSPIDMHIVGVPCSVSSPGIFGEEPFLSRLKDYIFQREKGLSLFLNLKEPGRHQNRVVGHTLPTIVLENSFPNWEAYLRSLRSPYRRRLKQVLTKGKDIELTHHSCRAFSPELHDQYLQVFKRSQGKLEKLSLAFFRNLPNDFRLTVARVKHKPLGWVITLHDDPFFYFFLGGIDYSSNPRFDTYFFLLNSILLQGIDSGARFIDFGQTAEIPKMRLGGQCQARYLEAQHRNRFVQKLLKAGQSLLTYHRELPETHVLKQAYENITRPA